MKKNLNTRIFAAEEIIKNFGMQIDCCIYLSLNAGSRKIEQNIILKFLEKSNEIEMDDELQGYILNHLKNTKCRSRSTIKKFLKDLKEESPPSYDLFREALRDIAFSLPRLGRLFLFDDIFLPHIKLP